MKYVGSKSRYVKEILPIILEGRKANQYYVEPFGGSLSVISEVEGPRIANDKHKYLIAMFRAVANGWIPPETLTEAEYNFIKSNKDLYPHLTGFVGFACSFGAKWFGGYARGNQKNGKARNYCAEGRRAIIKQAPKLKGIMLYNFDYDSFPIPDESIIYCDPPYKNTVEYKGAGDFDHDKFWAWCDSMVKKGHKVYVSEYSAPDGWRIVWQKEVFNSLDLNTGSKKGTEKLFTK